VADRFFPPGFWGCRSGVADAFNTAMDIHVLPAGPIETNAYLLTDTARHEAVLVDSPHDVGPEVQAILRRTGCKLVALLVTHGHWDHTGDAARIQQTGATLYAHEADRLLIEQPGVMEMFAMPGLRLDPAKIDRVVKQGDRFELLGETVEVRHVPGHCPGNVLFYFTRSGAAFVGDAIFAGSVGRTDFPGGGFEMLEHSIRSQIYTLPDVTALYPGHGPETTVADEKAGNPYVRG
jgi:hydroxyacylglutathione hydrolase